MKSFRFCQKIDGVSVLPGLTASATAGALTSAVLAEGAAEGVTQIKASGATGGFLAWFKFLLRHRPL